ncbi:hypothetical protein [Adhaeribacter pallidiroseus]|uniref:Uncharacterized protein n=1 Tax=Adhaeribacter pallidiroseus TaxID=2072847 RepID=A0A369Q8S4_9BACT|nr:hypothetical protein [Adhaeribacter pallidiroseus]RDC58688.1 hypothetical protein AHMF7616_05322 [Adhaeribacter pallidiroseus]RDC58731.1 hypothetical protein AHMF7616_05365 [Adhaeribacter pallidiroseus]
MQKITIKELIDFRRRSERSKKNFAFKLKNREAKVKSETNGEEGGGDYWVTSTSCIYNVFKSDNAELYDAKINELRAKLEGSKDIRIKAMYQRNIDILLSFKEFDFQEFKPSSAPKYRKVPKDHQIVTIENFPLFVNPSLLFTYEKDDKQELGALWLIPRLYGFSKQELGMFCEILYRLLKRDYADSYQISQDNCIAIDTFNAQTICYTDLAEGRIPFLVDSTLNEIKDL